MTITECQKRKKEYEQMLDNILDNMELLKLAIIRSIAVEDMNIAALKKQENDQKGDA